MLIEPLKTVAHRLTHPRGLAWVHGPMVNLTSRPAAPSAS